VVIPFIVNANEFVELTFRMADMDLPSPVNDNLEDTFANTITLQTNSNYVILPSTILPGTGRFFLRVSESVLLIIQNNLDN